MKVPVTVTASIKADVVHTAGVSSSMGDADIMTTNALGTLNVNEVFHDTAAEGAAIVTVGGAIASMKERARLVAGSG